MTEITSGGSTGNGSTDAVVVTVHATAGSAPREPGAWMAVTADVVEGTIGGGHLEYEAIAEARRRLAGAAGEPVMRYALGPSLGQCCGGTVQLRYARATPGLLRELRDADLAARRPVTLFGGGHVGRALVQALGALPFSVLWIDSRDEVFPAQLPDNVRCEHSHPVHKAVNAMPPHSHVLIMSFSHAEDLDIVAACLRRERDESDVRFIGLIGSKTKWATFRSKLEERGFTRPELAMVTCPIGLPDIKGKQPGVIAASVAAQLLQTAGN
ncbi:xanthine dehydrogenase accessory protein XdhC [Ramlibacter sp.]|uniref:xanthine dehydrogenase accessory protein XdhC n=1 Tax=Ramlibacter sp. TaxID=1917967 RepID=UPI003D14983A